ncbi:unnamed protein product, partial [Vitis vinifera]
MTRGTHRCPDQLYPYPPRGHVARTSIRVPQGGHTTLSNIILGRCSILSGPFVRIIDCNEQALLKLGPNTFVQGDSEIAEALFDQPLSIGNKL